MAMARSKLDLTSPTLPPSAMNPSATAIVMAVIRAAFA
jgi:hypothetical protein